MIIQELEIKLPHGTYTLSSDADLRAKIENEFGPNVYLVVDSYGMPVVLDKGLSIVKTLCSFRKYNL